MVKLVFSERVNAVSNVINEMTADPSERLGIVSALYEIYKHELSGYFTRIPTNPKQPPSANAATPPEGEQQK